MFLLIHHPVFYHKTFLIYVLFHVILNACCVLMKRHWPVVYQKAFSILEWCLIKKVLFCTFFFNFILFNVFVYFKCMLCIKKTTLTCILSAILKHYSWNMLCLCGFLKGCEFTQRVHILFSLVHIKRKQKIFISISFFFVLL